MTLSFVEATLADPLAQPLLVELADEYAQRYDETSERMLAWLVSSPDGEFAAPHGGMLIGLLEDGR